MCIKSSKKNRCKLGAINLLVLEWTYFSLEVIKWGWSSKLTFRRFKTKLTLFRSNPHNLGIKENVLPRIQNTLKEGRLNIFEITIKVFIK